MHKNLSILSGIINKPIGVVEMIDQVFIFIVCNLNGFVGKLPSECIEHIVWHIKYVGYLVTS